MKRSNNDTTASSSSSESNKKPKKTPRTYKSIAHIESNILSPIQIEAIRTKNCKIHNTSTIDPCNEHCTCDGKCNERKLIGKKGLYVCEIDNFIILDAVSWVNMRIRANVHIAQFGQIVNRLTSIGIISEDLIKVVLLKGGPDVNDKQSGHCLCPGSGPRKLLELGMTVQRSL